ncbi:MAG: phospholipid carrier-dependent glycosyltransferase, partial [Clostridia bacterium]|nr:phospholipid carrier-dependent glycosyltransferase [Clostridia bacterium]
MAFNPAALANSAAWGQIDSLLALAVALCALRAVEGRTARALIWFGVGLLIKPQAALFAPVGLAGILCGVFSARGDERKKRLCALGIGVVGCLGLLYAVAFVCCMGGAKGFGELITRPVAWLAELYTGTVQGYRYVTVNTLNLHYLLGMNWGRMEEHGAVAVCAWALFVLSYAGCIWLTVKSAKTPHRLFLTGGLLIVLVCAFGPMIHERYVFPGLLLLTLAFACEGDRRLLISLTALTATLFMNEVLVLQGGMTSANYGHLQSDEHWLNCILSAVNVLNALFLLWTAFDICVKDGRWPLRRAARESVPSGAYTLSREADWRLNLRRFDALAMGAVTLLYSVLAFSNLGVTNAPQTGWTSSRSGESVVFDLGQVETFRMTYYGGICNSAFSVELSNDGQSWTERCWAKYNQGEIFRWLWFVPQDESQNTLYGSDQSAPDGGARLVYASVAEDSPMQTARFVRISADSAGLILYEVGFLDGEGRALPIAGISQSGQLDASSDSAALLIDEQGSVAAYPSYLNSTYFDEIYHARTAYEHLHGLTAYEWTHPPLGKVLMMVGIQIFGMTPFGWRFMGALMGVLMLPVMYLLVKQLTKDSRLSLIAMCLMALDSMHFTQTRIATIDSYAVFWIMLMYLFMFRYCQMSWNRESLGRTLVPLGLCGVTMGIAWATKWVGLYASAGLAILFFWTVFRRLRELKHLKDRSQSLRSLVVTLLFCVLFFVIIPALIYYFSYYWLLRPEGVKDFGDMLSSDRVKRVIELQKGIFSYHAGLGGDTHYFRSPWYQWPVIWWPMWYFSGTAYMPEGMISSISCMGNPAVWWFGLAAMLYVTVRMCWQRRAPGRYIMVVVGFASQFLPWVLVPRSTFIYHYFASVPFIIIASVLLLDAIRRRSEQAFHITSGALLGAALILFTAFYPLESGLPCSREYAKYLRWFKWYNY